MNNKLTLGFSPCPNDTFIFDALIHGKIDTEGLEFDVYLGDVEDLNQKAFNKELDITKISYHAFGYLTNDYILLDAGSALGKGCGPILVKSSKVKSLKLADVKIAIPGKFTTANFLLSIAHPEATNKVELLFSDIEKAVLNNNVNAGLLIHENRFTYQERGLEKIIDLGEYWEEKTGALIPLGGIVIKRNLPTEIIQKVNRLLRKSIEYAFNNPESPLDYMQKNAQEMDEKVMMQHVELYVNKYSLDLGVEGKDSITQMFNLAQEKGIIPKLTNKLFVS
ncbi:MAG: 1,4-dihydroxy-6-naphthoate synthase [Flavobacteriales bacterium]|nr:1,4-dihydroxy-6-naphthoate synthase [Flavobacteriales bacterium]MCB9364608.1 1,4-dihydroxy-6-naphthoate synthase [Flavobacteriales bacterium]